MHFIPYNSRVEYHKYPFGAVPEGTAVTFRVILPRYICCRGVDLVIASDEGDSASLPMEWECMEGENEEWWRVEYTPSAMGIYWYKFTVHTDGGDMYILCLSNGCGAINMGGDPWQLTVYEKDLSTPSWVREGVIYQIFPDRFCNSGIKKNGVSGDRILRSDWGGEPMWAPDENGDINEYDFFGGDFKGIEQKLEYLASLSVSCIYLNPVFEAHSNHRYDTANYEKTDPLLGTQKDFVSLCRAAKKLGIRIILDGVFSHTGADSKYFNKNNRYKNIGAYNSKESEYYKWYKFVHWPDDYKGWWGIKILPETNEEQPDYLEYITGENGILRKWLRLGASGWRLDVADELPDVFLDSLNRAVKEEKPDAYILGEVWEDATNKISYGVRRRYLLGGQLDSVMNYPFAEAVLDFAETGNAEGLMSVVTEITENYPKPSLDTLMNHIGTHDTVRALTRLSGDATYFDDRRKYSGLRLSEEQRDRGIRRLKMAAALQYTLPGVPCVYYGDEAGLEGYRDPFNRACYPWGNENTELVEYYRRLGKIRKDYSALHEGRFVPVSAAMGCIAYARVGENETIVVISNSNGHEINYHLQPEWFGVTALMGGECSDCGENVKIAPHTTAVLLKK
ncbi:MAG: glycoside hydrolase family 13 protein [Clostridiales bacterium]|nr:glycoside hydrolase family 13 protein [Clostridiales bacterium]